LAAALDGREQELAQQCIDEADGHIPRLKNTVPRVAASAGVPMGVLAYYVAHKLDYFHQENWWGTATTLAAGGPDPRQQAYDRLLASVELRRLDSLDREILARALCSTEKESE
jgi:hypothetical protein